jgi:ribose 1,5-bisphosphokinase PhnN
MPTRLILVGGFLGAGKTTLLWEAARRLTGRAVSFRRPLNGHASACYICGRRGFAAQEFNIGGA